MGNKSMALGFGIQEAMNNQEAICDLLTEIITGICAHRDELQINVTDFGKAKKIIIRPHMADYRKLCGRRGVVITALKIIGETMAANAGFSLTIELHETEVGQPEPRERLHNQTFDFNKLERLIRETVAWTYAEPIGFQIVEDGDVIRVSIPIRDNEFAQDLLRHLAYVFYPYGKANGRTVEIRQFGPGQLG